jgi:RIO kinase 1
MNGNNVYRWINDEKQKNIFAKVFDLPTIKVIDSLSSKGFIDKLEFVVSTGKEAHVFRAIDASGNFLAVKVYKKEATDFIHMSQYIQGDYRFAKVKKSRRDIVFAWTKKEYSNLERAKKAGARVPLPIKFKENVLIMEFIGTNGMASRTLKEEGAKNYVDVYEKIVDFYAVFLYKAEMVHGDLSEYNVLMQNNTPVVIDFGQAVPTTHPRAEEYFERDMKNLANYFSKKGVNVTPEKIREKIKERKGLFKK